MLHLVTLACALACGLVGGFFFAFSTCIMRALGQMPPPQGIVAMQNINRVVINPWFMIPFVGMAAASVSLVVVSFLRWQDPRVALWLVGSVLYVVGTFGVTMWFNVPRNNALASVVPSSADGAQLWVSYLATWTAFNHVRTFAALAAALAFIIAAGLRR
jgi:uncharacterized membrane protein